MGTNDQGGTQISLSQTAPQMRLTRSGARRQGDEYQDVQAIDILVEWLEHRDRYQWIQLEADESGFLDDILAMRADGVLEAWQVKYSTSSHLPDDTWKWDALLERKQGKRGPSQSLLQKWFETWQKHVANGIEVAPGLISNRRAAPELALDTPQKGKVRWDELTEDKRKTILAQLGDEAQVKSFFELFHFRLDEPSLRELEESAGARFERLAGTQAGWYALEKAVREWVNTKDNPPPNGRISLEDLQRVAKLKAHPVTLRTFLPPASFFRRYLELQRLFHHRLPQVGRRPQLNELLKFVESKSQVALLPGRGGSGKSKLIFTLCRRLARRHPDLNIRLLAENVGIKETALEELPDDSCLVIVDDAHRISGLEVILGAARQNPNLKLLLVTRPHATEYLTAQTLYAGFDRTDIIINNSLPDLGYPREYRQLARLVLGRNWARYTDDLASATRDCPLLTVLGGQLLRMEKVAPSALVQNNTFRREVLSRFRDIRFGEIVSRLDSRFTPQLCADVLPLVAVMTPFDLEHTGLLQAVAKLAGTDEVKLKQLLGILVEAEALARGGRLVRIIPDVLSDFLLHEACFTPDGVPTGWAERAYQELADIRLDIVLRNLAELDWRVRTTPTAQDQSVFTPPTSETGLLDRIWHDIERRFRAGSLAEREAWFGRLERIAFMQPQRIWPFVEIAINEPMPEDPNEVSPELKGWIPPTTQNDVLAALVPILRGVACDDRFTARCANLLWEMGRDEEAKRGTSPTAMDTLRQLASYERRKPLAFNHIVLTCCRDWMNDPNIHSYRHSILEVLSPMLARRANWTEMDGRLLKYGSFILSPVTLRELRRGALELVERCALCGVHRIVLEALHTLHTPISEEDLWELKKEEPAEWHSWEDEQLASLDIVARVAQSNNNPFVRLRIWEELHWQAERGPRPAVLSRAREILEALPHSFESRFILLMTLSYGWEQYRRTWEHPEDTNENWLKADSDERILIEKRRHERNKEFAQQVTREWVESYPDPRNGFNALGEWIERIETSGWWTKSWTRGNPFILQLATDYPAYARAWCEIALENPEARATEKCDDLLAVLRYQDAAAAIELMKRYLAHGHPNLWQRVASSYSWPGWPRNPLHEEWQIVRELLTYSHPQVRRSAAQIVSAIASTDPGRALELVLETEVGDDSDFADGLYEIFDEQRGFDFDGITPDDLKRLLDKLNSVESVKSYHLGRFLLRAALRDPVNVAKLLLDRVRHKIKLNMERLMNPPAGNRLLAKSPVDSFGGLPESGFHDDKFKEVANHPDYPNALRLIRDVALSKEYHSDLLWEDTLSELFRDFSLNYGPTSLEVLNEWINSGDCHLLQSALRLLGDTYLGFYVGNLSFVSNYMRRAQECGRTVFEDIERTLLHYAEDGPPRAIASHRGERSYRLFHGALKALQDAQDDPLMSQFFQRLRDRGREMIQSEMKDEAEEEIFFRS